jgi:hypothetical protein
MKQVDLFKDFLDNTVNLNDTRVEGLETSIEAIKAAVREADWDPHIKTFEPQGSWAHKTIIRPIDAGEFDADLLVFVDVVNGWTASQYIDELFDALKENKTYKDMVKRWSHCVTFTYANDKKIDVAPCIQDANNTLWVCNRDTNQFERSEPRLYTDWLVEKNGYSGSNSFRKVTRLFKYLREIKTRFTCSSVLLTTLLGYRITSTDKDTDAFADTPTALKTVFGRLDDWLQPLPTKPSVTNPFLQTEDFADAWHEDQYTNFREKIHQYREWVDDAYNETDRSESIAKWRRVFGDDFAKGVSIEEGKSVSKAIVASVRTTLAEAAQFTGDLVDAIKRFGASRVLPPSFDRKPYMEAPQWRRSGNLAVSVRADLHRSKNGTQIRSVASLDPLQAGNWLRFRAVTATGGPFDSAIYQVMWRVTNTDEAAARENALRGRFEKAESDNTRWEELKYRGVHLVEAFVILKRNNTIAGNSPAFRVMIE